MEGKPKLPHGPVFPLAKSQFHCQTPQFFVPMLYHTSELDIFSDKRLLPGSQLLNCLPKQYRLKFNNLGLRLIPESTSCSCLPPFLTNQKEEDSCHDYEAEVLAIPPWRRHAGMQVLWSPNFPSFLIISSQLHLHVAVVSIRLPGNAEACV